MLNIKKLLTKVLNQVNFRTVEMSSSQVTLNAGGTSWITIPLPTTGKALCIWGYYLGGGANCSVYNIGWTGDGLGSIAVRNNGTSSVNVTVTARYLVVG